MICTSSVCARRKNMKSDVTSRKFPTSPEEWDAIIAEAPGEDRPPTPEEEAALLAMHRGAALPLLTLHLLVIVRIDSGRVRSRGPLPQQQPGHQNPGLEQPA